MVINYLQLPLNSFKRVGQCLGHSCCQTAIDKVLEWSEAKRRLLPELVQVHVDHIATNRKRKGTCQRKQKIKVTSTAAIQWKIIEWS